MVLQVLGELAEVEPLVLVLVARGNDFLKENTEHRWRWVQALCIRTDNRYLLIKRIERENNTLAEKMYSIRKVTDIITFQMPQYGSDPPSTLNI